MRIGIVVFTDFPEGSAAARRVHMLGKGLANLGHQVQILVPLQFHAGPLFQEFDGLQVRWGTRIQGPSQELSVRLVARREAIRLVKQVVADNLDWLVLYNLGLEGIPLLLIGRRHGVKVAAEYCDLRAMSKHPGIGDRFRVFSQSAADVVIPRLTQLNIVISEFLKERVRSLAPRTPIVMVPSLVDIDRFCYNEAKAKSFRTRWNLGHAIVISYFGTYWSVDGVGTLLRAAKEMMASGEQFRLTISGSPPAGQDFDDVPRLVDELGVREKTILTGWLATDDVVAGMSAADVLVVPKIDHIANQAGFPTKISEYLSMGKAVVASRVGDIPLYLQDGRDALLCEPGDPQSLAFALGKIIRNSELRHQLAENAREIAVSHFDYRPAGKRIELAMLSAHKRRENASKRI